MLEWIQKDRQTHQIVMDVVDMKQSSLITAGNEQHTTGELLTIDNVYFNNLRSM